MIRLIVISLAILFAQLPAAAQDLDSDPKLKQVPPVVYPGEAMKTGLEGTVSVIVDLDEGGRVTKTHDATGPDWVCPSVTRPDVLAMRQTATRAAEKATFLAATKEGKPVASQAVLRFKFIDPTAKARKPDPVYGVTGVGSPPDDTALLNTPAESVATRDTQTVGGGAIAGSAKSLPQPPYPAAARAVRAGGTVEVQVVIDTNGTILSAEAISGHPLLRAASRTAACKARFAPTLLSGQPVKVSGIINYNFVP